MNLNNVKTWVAALRDPSKKQVRGALKRDGGNCCLGLGCEVMGLEPVFDQDTHVWGYRADADMDFGYLPPMEFHHWLGIEPLGGSDDVYIDWPVDLLLADGYTENSQDGFVPVLGCAVLNDTVGLSFSQIADLIDYFGVRDTASFSN